MMLGKKWVLRNELDGSGGGGLDMAAAVDQIGSELGFEVESNDDDVQGGTDDLGSGEPAASPAPPAPPAAPAAPAVPPAPPAPAPAPGAGPAAPTPPAPPAGPVRFTADTPPSTWTHAAASQWAQLPQSIREEVARRENNMFAGLEQYKGDAGVGRQVKSILAPVMPNLEATRITPQQFIGSLVQAHSAMADPKASMESKVALVHQMLKGYGIQLTPQAPADPGTPAYVDPEVQALREELAAVKSTINASVEKEQNAVAQQRSQAIEAFAADPANPYFYDVADEIAMLIRGSGGKMSLQDAYKQAVRLNPVTFARETERLQAEAVEKANKEAADRAAAAKRASGARVKSSGHQGGGTADSGSMEDTMQATLDEINARARKS